MKRFKVGDVVIIKSAEGVPTTTEPLINTHPKLVGRTGKIIRVIKDEVDGRCWYNVEVDGSIATANLYGTELELITVTADVAKPKKLSKNKEKFQEWLSK